MPVPVHRDEVSALAVTMNDMLARIQSGHAAQRRFVGDASHELRSPLSTIISALEVGLTHPDLLKAELVGEAVLPEAQRMQTLIDDLLLLARADEHGVPLRTGDVDLDDLAVAEARRIERATTHTVQADLAPARLTGDADALTRFYVTCWKTLCAMPTHVSKSQWAPKTGWCGSASPTTGPAFRRGTPAGVRPVRPSGLRPFTHGRGQRSRFGDRRRDSVRPPRVGECRRTGRRRNGDDRSASCAQRVEPVTHPAHGFDGVGAEWGVDLAAQIPHVDLDDVIGSGVVGVPDMVQDLRFGDGDVLVTHQVLQ